MWDSFLLREGSGNGFAAYAGRMRHLLIGTLLIAAACSTGPAAPEVDPGAILTACIDPFCIAYPSDWVVEERGADFISFFHPLAPAEARATIAPVNPQAIAESAGGSLPAASEEVVDYFWMLLDINGASTLEHVERLTGGAYRSEGSYEKSRLWHLLIPDTTEHAVAVEVRGPSDSWEPHADVFFSEVEVLE